MAGDVNADALVDGVDSGLLAGAEGRGEADADYLYAADLDGSGAIDAADRAVLVANYGFRAVPVTLQQGFGTVSGTAPPLDAPARPDFDLEAGVRHDAARRRADVAWRRSSWSGTPTPNVTLVLAPTGAVTRSDCTGMFAFLDVPLAEGNNLFTVVATSDAGLTSQFSRTITRLDASADADAPVVTAALANDTGRDAAPTASRTTRPWPAPWPTPAPVRRCWPGWTAARCAT